MQKKVLSIAIVRPGSARTRPLFDPTTFVGSVDSCHSLTLRSAILERCKSPVGESSDDERSSSCSSKGSNGSHSVPFGAEDLEF